MRRLLAICSAGPLLLVPGSAAAAKLVRVEQVAVRVAATIRHDARQDRHAPKTTVVAYHGSGEERLTVTYVARPNGEGHAGDYRLRLVERAGRLQSVIVSAATVAPDVQVESVAVTRQRPGRWIGTRLNGGSGAPCGPGPCTGLGGADSELAGSATEAVLRQELLEPASRLITAGRHHAPVV